jgi:hypothetical protein
MAKCMQSIKDKAEVKRISNQEAKRMFESGKWQYISKSDYNRVKAGFVNGNGVNNQSKG